MRVNMKVSIRKTIFLIILWGSIYGLYMMGKVSAQEHAEKVKMALKYAKTKQEVKKVFNTLVNCETYKCVGGMTFLERKNIFMQIAKQEKISTDGF